MKKLYPLRFDKFNKVNSERCEIVYHKINDWSPSDWGNALAGEVGEACNFIKKLRRLEGLSGAKINKKRKRLKEALAKELGDIFHYLDLTATRLDIDLGKAVVDKFNEVSKRTGYDKVFILK